MELLVFNRSGSSCAFTAPLTLSFSPTTHPHTHPTTHSTTTTTHAPLRASSPILPPTPQMANHRTEQEQPPRERPPPATTTPALAFHPARAWSAGHQPTAGAGSHPARAASAGNLPVRGPLSAAHGPVPGPFRSAPAPQVGETTVLRRSPDWVAAASEAATGEDTRPARPDPYTFTPLAKNPSPGWFQTGVRAVWNMLPGADLGHRVSRSGRNPSQGHPPITVDAYVGTSFPDTARFGAIPRRRGIRTLSPHGRFREESRPAAWRTRWLHAAHRAIADSRSDLLYIRCAGEDHYHARLFELFEKFGGEVNPEPHVRLVAFPRPFARWYSVADRVRWGKNSAKENQLRWRRTDAFFDMRHTTEFFAVPLSARGGCIQPCRGSGVSSRLRCISAIPPRARWRMSPRGGCWSVHSGEKRRPRHAG